MRLVVASRNDPMNLGLIKFLLQFFDPDDNFGVGVILGRNGSRRHISRGKKVKDCAFRVEVQDQLTP